MNWLDKLKGCRRCDLHRVRRNVVIGRGKVPADILFIGEAPGRVEDLLGFPFTGPSGLLLNQMIEDAAKLDRKEVVVGDHFLMMDGVRLTWHITNTIFCHPTDQLGGDNRPPYKKELVACARNVASMIDRVKPRIIIAVGKTAERYCRKLGKLFKVSAINHPAFLLRQGGRASPHYLLTIRNLSGALTYAKDTQTGQAARRIKKTRKA